MMALKLRHRLTDLLMMMALKLRHRLTDLLMTAAPAPGMALLKDPVTVVLVTVDLVMVDPGMALLKDPVTVVLVTVDLVMVDLVTVDLVTVDLVTVDLVTVGLVTVQPLQLLVPQQIRTKKKKMISCLCFSAYTTKQTNKQSFSNQVMET